MDVANDIELKQRAERAQLRKDAELFSELLKHPGWPRLIAVIEAVAQNYHNAAMKPLENVLEVTKPEFAKGVLTGLTLASAIPNMKMKEAQDLRNAQPDDEE